jgi:hypothetical protein
MRLQHPNRQGQVILVGEAIVYLNLSYFDWRVPVDF